MLNWRISFVFILQLCCVGKAHAWGFYAHRMINQYAVFAMPPECNSFFKANLLYLQEHAVDPDKRRNAVEGEAPKHYIDIDHFDSANPFDAMPRKWSEAVAKFTTDTLKEYGTLPWHILGATKRLEQAMIEHNTKAILKLCADLGHYVADATVPLHTTENYDGQLTDQRGIHKLWESRVPELKGKDYQLIVGKATYISNQRDWIWNLIENSHEQLESVLSCETEARNAIRDDQQQVHVPRGQTTVKAASEAFVNHYDKCLNGMVETQLKIAVKAVADLWYTAWINAGQPKLITESKQNNEDLSVPSKAVFEPCNHE